MQFLNFKTVLVRFKGNFNFIYSTSDEVVLGLLVQYFDPVLTEPVTSRLEMSWSAQSLSLAASVASR